MSEYKSHEYIHYVDLQGERYILYVNNVFLHQQQVLSMCFIKADM